MSIIKPNKAQAHSMYRYQRDNKLRFTGISALMGGTIIASTADDWTIEFWKDGQIVEHEPSIMEQIGYAAGDIA